MVAVALFFFVALQVFWPAPVGVYLQGVVIGGLTALIAFGLALTYRSNRIINFAQGDLGGIPATAAVLLLLGPHLSYFLAVPLGLLGAIVLGALIEFVFIRRFFKAPRLILTVVTIGISQILAGITTALPQVIGYKGAAQQFNSPFSFHFNIGKVVFQGNEVVAMVVVPVVIVALAAFFRYTNIGIAVRASAESADRAALLGVPVKAIQTVVWTVASALAFIAIFLRAGIIGLPIGSVLGPTVLVRALAAAVMGRMERLPTIFFASVGLGIIESAIVFRTGRAFLVDPILFGIVLVALLVQRRGVASRVDDDQTSSWQAAREVRPAPREIARLPEFRVIKRGLGVVLGLFLIGLPLILNDGQTNLAGVVIVFALVGVSMVVLTGWAGQVSLGQIGFLAIGAAVGGYLTATQHWDLSLAMLVAGLAGAAAAIGIGLPALRIRGLFLAVVSLSFGLAVSSYVLNPTYVHWLPKGTIPRVDLFGRISVESETRYYYLCLAVLALMVAAVRGLRHSRTGRVLIAVRENPRAAQAFGVNTTVAKLTAFAFSGFIAAFAGALFVHHQQALGASFYTVDQSRKAFIMVVIGGLGSIPGAILGAVFIQGVNYFQGIFPMAVRPYLEFFTSGIGLIFVLLIVPGGFSQIFYGIRDRGLRMMADRRGLIVPSLVADMRATTPSGISIESAEPLPPDPGEIDVVAALEEAVAHIPEEVGAP